MEQLDVTTLLLAVPELSDGAAPLKPQNWQPHRTLKCLHSVSVLARLAVPAINVIFVLKFLV